MQDVLLIAGMAAVTFLIRYPLLVLVGRLTLPTALQRGLRYVPVAVLAAIIAPALLMPAGTLDVSLTNTPLLAGMIAFLVAWRSKNLLLTIVIGMAALLLLRALSG